MNPGSYAICPSRTPSIGYPMIFAAASFITNALYVKGLEDAAWLADEMGAARDAERWRGSAAHIKAALRELHWNEARSLFVDSYREGPRI